MYIKGSILAGKTRVGKGSWVDQKQQGQVRESAEAGVEKTSTYGMHVRARKAVRTSLGAEERRAQENRS